MKRKTVKLKIGIEWEILEGEVALDEKPFERLFLVVVVIVADAPLSLPRQNILGRKFVEWQGCDRGGQTKSSIGPLTAILFLRSPQVKVG